MPENLEQKMSDSRELRIRESLRAIVLSAPWAREAVAEIRKELYAFFLRALSSPTSADLLPDMASLLRAIATSFRTTIVAASPIENLESIEGGMLVVTNHFGIAKLTDLNPACLGLSSEQLGFDEPFPARYASLSTLASMLDRPIHEAAGRQPPPLDAMQYAVGVVTTTYGALNGLRELESGITRLLMCSPRALIVGYPESGTSGKYNGGGPYDLGLFHSGMWVAAAHLQLPIVPVCQYFDPKKGMRLGVLSAVREIPVHSARECAENVRASMQQWLKSQHSGSENEPHDICDGNFEW